MAVRGQFIARELGMALNPAARRLSVVALPRIVCITLDIHLDETHGNPPPYRPRLTQAHHTISLYGLHDLETITTCTNRAMMSQVSQWAGGRRARPRKGRPISASFPPSFPSNAPFINSISTRLLLPLLTIAYTRFRETGKVPTGQVPLSSCYILFLLRVCRCR
jgi:hypothetical protein